MSVLEINDFTLEVNNQNIVENLNFCINENEILGIYCPSGRGKTSLLNFIADVYHPNNKYKICGKKTLFKKNISYVFQESRFIPNITIKKNLLITSSKKNIENLNEIIEKVNIKEKLNSFPSELSGGQLQRASIARALLFPFDLLLLDEPFAFQDEKNKEGLILLIKEYVLKNNKAAIIVSHNHDELDKLATKVISF